MLVNNLLYRSNNGKKNGSDRLWEFHFFEDLLLTADTALFFMIIEVLNDI